jgi:hypothetical protein
MFDVRPLTFLLQTARQPHEARSYRPTIFAGNRINPPQDLADENPRHDEIVPLLLTGLLSREAPPAGAQRGNEHVLTT